MRRISWHIDVIGIRRRYEVVSLLLGASAASCRRTDAAPTFASCGAASSRRHSPTCRLRLCHSCSPQWRRHGVDMSTPLLIEVAPEIDINLTSFYRGGWWGGGVRSGRLRLQTPVIGSRSALAMSVHPDSPGSPSLERWGRGRLWLRLTHCFNIFMPVVRASEQGIGFTLTIDSADPWTHPHDPRLWASLGWPEIGAKRAENRVNGSGAVIGGYGNRYERWADISLLTLRARALVPAGRCSD